MFKVRQYTREDELEWNNFVENSKQGTFLFNRSYMDYHADRFHDCSLMVYRKDRLYALLPANRVDTTLYSHQGLTYGGLITNAEATAVGVCEAFLEINKYLYGIGIQHVLYKCMPWIYHRIPAEEDLYALFHVCKARLIHRYIASTIDQTNPIKWRKDRQHGVKSALKEGLIIERKSKDLDLFWDILTNNLQATYHAKPVHTLEEMTLLTHHSLIIYPYTWLDKVINTLQEYSSTSHLTLFTRSIYQQQQKERNSMPLMLSVIRSSKKTIKMCTSSTLALQMRILETISMLVLSSKRRALAHELYVMTNMNGT